MNMQKNNMKMEETVLVYIEKDEKYYFMMLDIKKLISGVPSFDFGA